MDAEKVRRVVAAAHVVVNAFNSDNVRDMSLFEYVTELEAALRELETQPTSQPCEPTETWVLKYDDASVPDEVFVGAGAAVAAQKRYDEASNNSSQSHD